MLQVITLPLDILSLENVASDVFHGCFVVTCTLFAFIGLVWLREQILHGGGPDWLERDNNNIPAAAGDNLLPPAHPAPPDNNNVLEPHLQQGVDQVGGFTLPPVDIEECTWLFLFYFFCFLPWHDLTVALCVVSVAV